MRELVAGWVLKNAGTERESSSFSMNEIIADWA